MKKPQNYLQTSKVRQLNPRKISAKERRDFGFDDFVGSAVEISTVSVGGQTYYVGTSNDETIPLTRSSTRMACLVSIKQALASNR